MNSTMIGDVSITLFLIPAPDKKPQAVIDEGPSIPSAMDGRANPRWLQVLDANGQALAYVYGREARALPTLPMC